MWLTSNWRLGQLTHWSRWAARMPLPAFWSHLGFVTEWIRTWRSVASSSASGQQRNTGDAVWIPFHSVPNADLVRTFRLATRKELRDRFGSVRESRDTYRSPYSQRAERQRVCALAGNHFSRQLHNFVLQLQFVRVACNISCRALRFWALQFRFSRFRVCSFLCLWENATNYPASGILFVH